MRLKKIGNRAGRRAKGVVEVAEVLPPVAAAAEVKEEIKEEIKPKAKPKPKKKNKKKPTQDDMFG